MAVGMDYALLAQVVYQRDSAENMSSWDCQRFVQGTLTGDGFQGAIFSRSQEIVVAFKGTKPKARSGITDLVADIKIGLMAMPNQVRAGMDLINKATQVRNGRKISIVGHSLGGGLAQVVGTAAGIPYVSFNAPGMAGSSISKGKGFFSRFSRFVSKERSNESASKGVNFRVDGDPVSKVGKHIGPVLVTKAPATIGRTSKHGMDACQAALARTHYWNADFYSNIFR